MLNLYFDNAATSFPKPAAVAEYTSLYFNKSCGTYGRAAYPRIIGSTGTVEKLRELVAGILGVGNAENVVFTNNATQAINTILFGLDLHDCNILVSPLEHNAVMRPLLEISHRNNISYDILPHAPDGLIDLDKIGAYIRPATRLVIINHQSNVNGLIQPVKEIKARVGNIPVMIDLSQSLGHIDITTDTWEVDLAVFTGHKGLLGPTGTGGFFIKDKSLVKPLIYGGTGSSSTSYEMPSVLPDKFEAGTPNVAGFYGLLGALEYRPASNHTKSEFICLLDCVSNIRNINVLRSSQTCSQGSLFSITHSNLDSGKLAEILYSRFNIETRSGLHCSPLAHQTLGTFPEGSVRFAMSPYHSKEDFAYLLKALETVSSL
ncbi:MAG TPA: aminotransferase class V-fold PLP-dependent enzyme [Chitinispirillaceae bacterium]|nr:aminotransferase class V-fold PLP-dependent enzyme [Chitinispirillaceae bacterium]